MQSLQLLTLKYIFTGHLKLGCQSIEFLDFKTAGMYCPLKV